MMSMVHSVPSKGNEIVSNFWTISNASPVNTYVHILGVHDYNSLGYLHISC